MFSLSKNGILFEQIYFTMQKRKLGGINPGVDVGVSLGQSQQKLSISFTDLV
jgi:hypothetical protein